MTTAHTRPAGKTTVAPDVLITVARMSALSVPGVRRMAAVSGGVNRLLRRGDAEGVRLIVRDNTVVADVYLVLAQDVNVREVSRSVQQQVARSVQEMVGMDIEEINVHIEDIDYEADSEA